MGIGKKIKVRFPVCLILQPTVDSDRGEISFCSLIAGADQAPLVVDCALAWTPVTTRCHSRLGLKAPQLLFCRAYSTGMSFVTHIKQVLLNSELFRYKPKDFGELKAHYKTCNYEKEVGILN